MPYSGGTFTLTDLTRTGASICQEQKLAGLDVKADLMDNIHNDIVSGLNTALLKDGTNSPTQDIPMGTYKFTGVGNGAARNDFPAIGQIQDNSLIFATSGGSANAQTLNLSPDVTALVTGSVFWFIAGYTNTGATTLTVDGTAATDIYSNKTGAALAGNEIIAGRAYQVMKSSSQFLLLNPSEEWQSFTPSPSVDTGSVSFASTSGQYRRVGKKIEFYWASVMTYASGSPREVRFNLPVTAVSSSAPSYSYQSALSGIGAYPYKAVNDSVTVGKIVFISSFGATNDGVIGASGFYLVS